MTKTIKLACIKRTGGICQCDRCAPKRLTFIIRGNQEDPEGNPIGYHRTTQGSYWNEGSRRYYAWKEYVVAAFERGTRRTPKEGKPLALKKGEKAQVAIKVYWKNGAHADLENIVKGVLDSLFENDKCVNGIKATCEPAEDGKGRVEVEITL